MGHIHTRPGDHDLTVSAYIIRTDFEEPKAMLHKHKKLGMWLQFGGHVELHENPWQALTHELLEESGYSIDQLRLLETTKRPIYEDATSHPIPFSFNTHKFSSVHNHTDIGYAFTTAQKPRHTVAKDESEDIKCFSKKELQEIPKELLPNNVLQNFLHAFELVKT